MTPSGGTNDRDDFSVDIPMAKSIFPFHIFGRNGKTYFLNLDRLIAAEVSASTAAALDHLSQTPGAPLSPSVRSELKDLGFPENEPDQRALKDIELEKDAAVSAMSLLVTEHCNLRCTYCFGSRGENEMTESTALLAVDWLIGQSKQGSDLSICFFGGEPVLNFSLIKRVVTYARRKGEEVGKRFSFSITTNAILLDDNQIAFLREHNFFVLVSLDGPLEIQDRNRPCQGGVGSYLATVPRIKRLLEVMEGDHISCRATFCGRTEVENVYAALRGLGFPTVDIKPVSPPLPAPGAARYRETVRQLRKSEEYRQQLIRHFEQDAVRFRRAVKEKDRGAFTPMQVYGKLLRRLTAHKKIIFPCSAGREAIGVSTDGTCYPCHRFLGVSDYRIGRIDSRGLAREEYLETPMRNREPCYSCWALAICAGGCYYDNLAMTGDRFTPSRSFCEDLKLLIEMAIELYCGLEQVDRDWLMEETQRLQQKSHPAHGSFFAVFQRELGDLLK